MALRDDFLRPPALDHPTPFWFWNDVLEPDEVRRQLGEMLDREMGGAFLHARMGRVTPYMSEAWMTAIRAAADTAAERGAGVWIYDEDNWPSGYGGGIVCNLGREYLQRYVRGRLEPIPEGRVLSTTDEVLAVYAGRALDERTVNLIRVPYTPPAGDAGERTIDFSKVAGDVALICWIEYHDRPRYFSPECWTTGYVDVMDPKVTDAFLDAIYEKYKELLGDHFGTAVPGFFIDEPSYLELAWASRELRRPWTGALPELYRERTGRDLLDDLPALFYDTGDPAFVRYHFHQCVSDLFVGNFTQRIADWCAKNGVMVTGHVILEEHLRAATQTIGNPLAHYEAMQLPGIDHLGRDLDLPHSFWSASRVLVKQVASVAHQLGRPRTMCETFAGGSWDFGVLEQKWMGDFLVTLGTTLVCQHACHYSLRGFRKRDYPPSLSFQQPWWPHSAGLNRHFGRLGQLSTHGKRQVAVAVLHPMGSFFATHNVCNLNPSPDPVQQSFKGLCDLLVEEQIDFDFLDEGILARHGKVEGDRLVVGEASYHAVVIPHLVTIRAATLERLRELGRGGGAVAAVQPFPARVDGAVNDRASAVFKRVDDLGRWDEARGQVAAWIRRHAPASVRLVERPPHPVFTQHRRTADEDVLLISADTKEPFEVTVELETPSDAFPRRWDTVSDAVEALDGWREEGRWRFVVPLDRGRSHVIVVPHQDDGLRPSGGRVQRTLEVIPAGQPVGCRRLAPNALALDRCWTRSGDGPWSDLGLVLHAARRKAESSYASPQGKGDRQTGALPGQRLTLRFLARSDVDLPAAELALETPSAFQLTVNGQPVDTSRDHGWFVDTSLRRIPLPPLAAGDIGIELSCDFDGSQEFDTLFLLGDFDVELRDGEPRIKAPTATLTVGDWEEQGLPFFAGRIVLEATVALDGVPPRARLACDAIRHTAAVTVNGAACGHWLWPPFAVEVGHALHAGENRIEIEVANSLRNFYGPHHLRNEEDIECLGPGEILARSAIEVPYRFRPAGLLAPVVLELLDE